MKLFSLGILSLLICGAFLSASGQDNTNAYCGPGNLPTVAANDGPAALPTRCMFTQISSTPSSNYPKYVGPLDSLPAALAAAVPGDTLVVDPLNQTIVNTTLQLATGDCAANKYVTVRTASSLIPDEYTRIRPSDAPQLPKIVINTSNGRVTGGACLRLIGFEITRKSGGGVVYGMVSGLGHDVILDRDYIHGTATDETLRGLDLSNSTNVAVINSYFSDFHCRAITGQCNQSQAIAGGLDSVPNTGNYKLVNNYIEGAGENFILGGGPATVTPTDITVMYNDIAKKVSWSPIDSSYDGGTAGTDGVFHPWVVINLFELKNAKRVLLEGNYLNYSWGGFSQVGAGILLTPKNQAGPNGTSVCPACQLTDATVRYNHVDHVAQFIQAGCGGGDNGGLPAACGQLSIHDNNVTNMQYKSCYSCGSFLNQLGGGTATLPWSNIYMTDNTMTLETPATWMKPAPNNGTASAADGVLVLFAPLTGISNIHFDRNAFPTGNNGIYTTGPAGGQNCISTAWKIADVISKCWINGSSMTGNQFLTPDVPFTASRLPWPAGNGASLAGADISKVSAALANRH